MQRQGQNFGSTDQRSVLGASIQEHRSSMSVQAVNPVVPYAEACHGPGPGQARRVSHRVSNGQKPEGRTAESCHAVRRQVHSSSYMQHWVRSFGGQDSLKSGGGHGGGSRPEVRTSGMSAAFGRRQPQSPITKAQESHSAIATSRQTCDRPASNVRLRAIQD
jgi:hypothetical protein